MNSDRIHLVSEDSLAAALGQARGTMWRCPGDPETCEHPYHSSDRSAVWEQAEDREFERLATADRQLAVVILAAHVQPNMQRVGAGPVTAIRE